MFLRFWALCLFIFVSTLSFSQSEDPIFLANPSFEDYPRHSKAPKGWFDCGKINFPVESPPDVQPMGGFEVIKDAYDGNTYLGMVVRDNDTWESLSQRLSRPLEKGKCYSFQLFLARSDYYLSISRTTEQEENYTAPARVRIWGGSGYCNKRELLGETSTIEHDEWKPYDFKFEPRLPHTYIVMEVFYKTPTLFPYNGNVLIDNASPITPIPCDEELLATTDPLPEPEKKVNEKPAESNSPVITIPKAEPKPNEPIVSPPPANQPPKEKITANLDRKKIRTGQTIGIEKLYFDVDTYIIREESYESLNEIYHFLSENEDVKIEIGGHTSGNCDTEFCDWLSAERAKAVAEYLTGKGVATDRITYKGYGKRKPKYSNKTSYGRKKNQRVEIKILSFND